MHGNVREWCQDRYDDYPCGSVTDPTGPSSGSYRVRRGGGWNYGAANCRAAYRSKGDPTSRTNFNGFRVLRSSVK